jgi:hypothetical protein
MMVTDVHYGRCRRRVRARHENDLLHISEGAQSMKREPREIAVIAEMAVFLFAAMLTVAPVAAQQVTGTLGEPSATTTINGKQIPAPPPPFGGSNVGSLRDFERFLRACALRSANLLNKADLARDVGIAPSTANQWLSMLEASGQAVMLQTQACFALF